MLEHLEACDKVERVVVEWQRVQVLDQVLDLGSRGTLCCDPHGIGGDVDPCHGRCAGIGQNRGPEAGAGSRVEHLSSLGNTRDPPVPAFVLGVEQPPSISISSNRSGPPRLAASASVASSLIWSGVAAINHVDVAEHDCRLGGSDSPQNVQLELDQWIGLVEQLSP